MTTDVRSRDKLKEKEEPYRQLIGDLMWGANMTGQDVMNAVGEVAGQNSRSRQLRPGWRTLKFRSI